MKISGILKEGRELLSKAGIYNPQRESKLIVYYALNINIENSFLDTDNDITKLQIKKILSLFKRRSKGEPFSYLTKSAFFLDLLFI